MEIKDTELDTLSIILDFADRYLKKLNPVTTEQRKEFDSYRESICKFQNQIENRLNEIK